MHVNLTESSGATSIAPETKDYQGVRRTAQEMSNAVEPEQANKRSVPSAEEPSSSGATAEAAQETGSSRGGNIDLMA